MAKYASEVVNLAKAWIGKNESDGSHKEIIDIYNNQKNLPRGYRVKYSDAWCATMVSALAIKLGYTSIIPLECGCGEMIKKAVIMGIWNENDGYVPSPGDIIMYDWQDSGVGDNAGWSDHVGVVESVAEGKITVIEGNYLNAVKRRVIDINGRYIRGFICPRYDLEVTPPTTNKQSLEEVAKAVIRGAYGNGTERKKRLAAAGYDYAEVQRIVNKLLGK